MSIAPVKSQSGFMAEAQIRLIATWHRRRRGGGKSDSKIAADLSVASNQSGIQQTQITVSDAQAYRQENSANKSGEMIPSNY
jgi:hypothetical protein